MQLSTALSGEELFAAARSEMRIAPFGKAAERCTGCRMQRNEGDLPNLVNRTVSTPALQIDVVWLGADHLGQTHARHRDQPNG